MSFKKTSSFFTPSDVEGWQSISWRRFTLLAVLATFSLSFVGQINYDTWLRYSPPKLLNVTLNEYIEPQPLSPSLAKAVSFGATEFMADYYWLTMIQYYGGGTPNGHYRKLAELFDTVTELSPHFTQAYQTGLVILPGEGFVDQAIALGKKGEQNLPDSWEMPYYTGLVYHIYKKDYIAAAKEFQLAADKPGAPPITRLFIGIYYNNANQRQIAYEIFRTVHETTTDSFVKDRSAKYITHLEIIFFIEDAVKKYHDAFGHYPATPQELVKASIITEVPLDPLNIHLAIDQKTGEVSEIKGPN